MQNLRSYAQATTLRGSSVISAKLAVPKKAVAPPADLGARISRYRCCLPALAEFST